MQQSASLAQRRADNCDIGTALIPRLHMFRCLVLDLF